MAASVPLIVVQCRYNSTRLPGKALYPLAGIPMVVFLLKRLKAIRVPNRMVLATTTGPEDEAVAAWGEAEGIDVIRGETDDVLARYIRCLESFPAPGLVRITADNPLTDPQGVEKVLEALTMDKYDYVSLFKRFPYGAGVDGFSGPCLTAIHQETKDHRDREHINAFILDNPGRFCCLDIDPPPKLARPDVRLTVDTKEEWEKVNSLFVPEDRPPYALSLKDAIERFDRTSF
jgi:spore coat polysaccharide biosynthesis protein SpsF